MNSEVAHAPTSLERSVYGAEIPAISTLDTSLREHIFAGVPGGAANVQDVLMPTPLQGDMLLRQILSESTDAYTLWTHLELDSRAKLGALVSAIDKTIDRHDALRTSFVWEGLPQPLRVIHRHNRVSVDEVTATPQGVLAAGTTRYAFGNARASLEQAPPVSLRVAADSTGRCWHVWLSLQGPVCDRESWVCAVTEVLARCHGSEAELTSAASLDIGAVRTEMTWREAARAFFHSKLSHIEGPSAPFGLDSLRRDANYNETRVALEPGLSSEVRRVADRSGVAPEALFHAAWAVVVARASARDDAVYATVPSVGARPAQRHRALGVASDVLPLVLSLSGLTAGQLIDHVTNELLALSGHRHVPFGLARSCASIPDATPLCTTLLIYRDDRQDCEGACGTDRGIRIVTHGETRGGWPIAFIVERGIGADGFILTARTDGRVNPQRCIDFLTTALRSLLHALQFAPGTNALTLSILSDGERRCVVDLFNSTQCNYPGEKLIHRLFEAQVRRTPHAIALQHGGRALTYAALDGEAQRAARYLVRKGVGPDRLVGICAERSVELVVGVLAILKSGGAYVPFDPVYPAERIEYMLGDAGLQLLLTHGELAATLPHSSTEVVTLEDCLREHCDHDVDDTTCEPQPDNLLYVIYTSGSTGKPKGVEMTHGAMANLIGWHRQTFDDRTRPRVLQFAALSFDVAFQEIFSTLCAGGTLVLLDEWIRKDARALMRLLIDDRIERLFVPPLLLQALAEYFKDTKVAPRYLRDVITAGEQLRISPEIAYLFESLPRCRLHNHYGPTETHVVTALTLSGRALDWPSLPTIGAPIGNARLYLLDDQRAPVPHGVVGEIYIGGVNLARGYRHKRELTGQRFMSDPYSAEPGARMYKTGDVGRWCSNGTIEYLGRNDSQVKIRGFRVELGEIEANLAQHPSVREVAVVAREDVAQRSRLVAYATLRDDGQPDAAALRAHLLARLPHYMVPSAFVILDNMPLTPSGKLDRRALPAPEPGTDEVSKHEAAQGEVESSLASIWQDLLQGAPVDRRDHFLERGGDSLSIMKLILQVARRFSIELQTHAVLQHLAFEDMARLVKERLSERSVQLTAELDVEEGEV